MSQVRRNRGFTLVELLVVIAIIGVLVALLLPAIQAAREAARRAQCQNNMRQLGLAAHSFHDSRRYLPSSIRPGGLTTSPRIAGLTFLLPYFDQPAAFDAYDQTVNWSHANNLPITAKPIPAWICPSTPSQDRLDGDPQLNPWTQIVAPSDYAAVIGVDQRLATAGLVNRSGAGILIKNGTPKLADVTDGTSNTIMYAESAGRPFLYRGKNKLQIGSLPSQRVNGGGWARPASDFSVDGSSFDGSVFPGPCALNCTNGEDVGSATFPYPYYGSEGTGEAYAFHPGGANFTLGDGSTRFISETIPIKIFAALVTRAGGESERVP